MPLGGLAGFLEGYQQGKKEKEERELKAEYLKIAQGKSRLEEKEAQLKMQQVEKIFEAISQAFAQSTMQPAQLPEGPLLPQGELNLGQSMNPPPAAFEAMQARPTMTGPSPEERQQLLAQAAAMGGDLKTALTLMQGGDIEFGPAGSAIFQGGQYRGQVPAKRETKEEKEKEKQIELLTPDEAIKLGVPYGTTKGEAFGRQPLTTQQREGLTQFASAKAIVRDIAKLSKTVNIDPAGLLGRAKSLGNVWGAFTQSNTDAALLQTKAGELSLLVRAMGEKGTLATKDVDRARLLVPKLT